jgi:hypothetical protein
MYSVFLLPVFNKFLSKKKSYKESFFYDKFTFLFNINWKKYYKNN